MNTQAAAGAPVVVGVDREDHMPEPVSWAADEAVRRRCPLLIAHAVDPVWELPEEAHATESAEAAAHETRGGGLRRAYAPDFPPAPEGDQEPRPLVERVHDAGAALLARAHGVAASRHPGLDVREYLTTGPVPAVLGRLSDEAAVLVIGSRGLSRIEEFLGPGSIAVPLAARTSCPLVVVRHRSQAAADPPFLVVGVDDSPRCEPALDFAFAQASARGARLHAVLVTRTGEGLPPPEARMFGQEDQLHVAEALAGRQEKYPEVVVHSEVVTGHPVQRLAAAARDALMVVVGTRGAGGFKGLLLGSVSQGLIHHATCPVAVVPST